MPRVQLLPQCLQCDLLAHHGGVPFGGAGHMAHMEELDAHANMENMLG